MNRVVYPKEKELTVMAQKKKDSKMMGKIIKTAVSGVLCVALAGGMVAANVLIPPNASSVQSILGLKSGGIDNSKAKTEGINMEYSKPGFDTEDALVEDEIALNKKIVAGLQSDGNGLCTVGFLMIVAAMLYSPVKVYLIDRMYRK